MTKAAICAACWDIVSPRRAWETDRSWRWCECDHIGVRWRDGALGLLEVASLHGADGVRVLGLNNMFLEEGMRTRDADPQGWRAWHEATCEQVEPHYLFHKDKRNCWALLVRPGESGDVFLMDYLTAKREAVE
ncbi:MAG TPA: hypothetical protein VG276_28020 [Actinomycetes bacterium]|jgi:hypothetical protein|nr:hypothetical protein [Actinomycetes bacterium]